MFGRTEVGGGHNSSPARSVEALQEPGGAPPPNQPPAAPHPPHEPPAAPAMQSNSGGAAATGSDTTEADRPDAVVPTVRPGIAAAKRRTDPLQWAKLSASTAFTDLKWFVTGKRLTPDHLSETVSKAAFVLKEIASGGDPLATAKRRELREFLDRRLAGKNPTALDAAARRKGRSLHGDFERLESALARPDQNSPEALHELESALSEVLASLRAAGLIERDDCDAICAPGWVDAPDMSFQFKPVDMERVTAGLEMSAATDPTWPPGPRTVWKRRATRSQPTSTRRCRRRGAPSPAPPRATDRSAPPSRTW